MKVNSSLPRLFKTRSALIFLFLAACANTGDNAVFSRVFQDFAYVGSGPSNLLSIPVHTAEEKTWPSKFEAGYQYVFHSRGAVDDEKLFETFQERLRSQGFNILDAKAEISSVIGGPFFTILFQEHGYKGKILNSASVIHESDNQPITEDYVLVLEKD